MKPIDKKSLIQAARSGKADISQVRNALTAIKKIDIDDRENDERLADEFEKLSKTMLAMSKEQANQFMLVLKTMTEAISKLSDAKTSAPDTIKMDVIDKKKEWDIEVSAKRDNRGLIIFPYNIKVKRT